MDQLKTALQSRNIDEANNISAKIMQDKVEGIAGALSFSLGIGEKIEELNKKENDANTYFITLTIEKKDLDASTWNNLLNELHSIAKNESLWNNTSEDFFKIRDLFFSFIKKIPQL
jgi:hypothetical protein